MTYNVFGVTLSLTQSINHVQELFNTECFERHLRTVLFQDTQNLLMQCNFLRNYTTLLVAITKYQTTGIMLLSLSPGKFKKKTKNTINNNDTNNYRPNLKQPKTSVICYIG